MSDQEILGPSEPVYWESVYGKEMAHYNIFYLKGNQNGMAALRRMFPGGRADEMNLCFFSTSGVHGAYTTIEEVERSVVEQQPDEYGDFPDSITFLIVHPRIVCHRYGNCRPENAEDIEFLKGLRESTWRAAENIGAPKGDSDE